jgi:hypothetical protein
VLTWPAHGGVACEVFQVAEQCNEWDCSRQCTMTPWSDWSPCSAECGVGEQTRTREVTMSRVDGEESCPATSAKRTCFEGACPVDCKVAQWGTFTACTKTCGGGIKARERKVLDKEQHGGADCGLLSETLACNEAACPTECVLSQWSTYTPCSKSCGQGSMSRDRGIIKEPSSGKSCGAVREDTACNGQACPVDCKVSSWGAFGACSAMWALARTRARARSPTAAAMAASSARPQMTPRLAC